LFRNRQLEAVNRRPGWGSGEGFARSGTQKYVFEVELHEMFEIQIEVFGGKLCQKLRLGSPVELDDKVDNFPFAHIFAPSKSKARLLTKSISDGAAGFLESQD
jgi:hypothetical protein